MATFKTHEVCRGSRWSKQEDTESNWCIWGVLVCVLARQVQDHFTYFPQFHGALKLLAGDHQEDGQVDAGVESRLQLESLSVPAGGQRTQMTAYSKEKECSCKFNKCTLKLQCVLTTVERCPCSWCLCSPSPGRCPCISARRGRTYPEPDVHTTATPAASLWEPALCRRDCSSCTNTQLYVKVRQVVVCWTTWWSIISVVESRKQGSIYSTGVKELSLQLLLLC